MNIKKFRSLLFKSLAYVSAGDKDGFVKELDNILEKSVINDIEKIDIVHNFGIYLYENALYSFTVPVWESLLRYSSKRGIENNIIAICTDDLGVVYRILGEYQQAIKYHKTAIEISERVGDIGTSAKCHNNIGSVYEILGQYQRAIGYRRKALDIARIIEDTAVRTRVQSHCHGNIAHDYDRLGEYENAILYYMRILKIAEKNQDPKMISYASRDLGLWYRNLGRYEYALEYLKKALNYAERIGDIQHVAACYNSLSVTYALLSKNLQAVKYHEMALDIAERIGDKEQASQCLGNLGSMYYSAKQYKLAINCYKKALKMTRSSDIVIKTKCLESLGLAYHYLGRYRLAIKYHKMALHLLKKIGHPSEKGIIYTNLGLSYRLLGLLEEAYITYKSAIELQELIGFKIVAELYKIWFNEIITDTYEFMVRICLDISEKKRSDKDITKSKDCKSPLLAEALEYTERSKSSALLSILSTNINLRRSSKLVKKYPILLENENKLLFRLTGLQMNHLTNPETNLSKIIDDPTELQLIRKQLKEIYDTIEGTDPEYVYLRGGRALRYDKIRAML